MRPVPQGGRWFPVSILDHAGVRRQKRRGPEGVGRPPGHARLTAGERPRVRNSSDNLPRAGFHPVGREPTLSLTPIPLSAFLRINVRHVDTQFHPVGINRVCFGCRRAELLEAKVRHLASGGEVVHPLAPGDLALSPRALRATLPQGMSMAERNLKRWFRTLVRGSNGRALLVLPAV